jgi:hypothetical protein
MLTGRHRQAGNGTDRKTVLGAEQRDSAKQPYGSKIRRDISVG